MGAANRPLTVETPTPQAAALAEASPCNNSRIDVTRDASQVRASFPAQVFQCFISERVEFARNGIVLELPIPFRRITLSEPRPKHPEFFRRHSLNRTFDVHDR